MSILPDMPSVQQTRTGKTQMAGNKDFSLFSAETAHPEIQTAFPAPEADIVCNTNLSQIRFPHPAVN